ncbi:MAG TPA: alpha/beta hydrolase [Candidatus Binatia bacterium]|nr:alpha/beta hydrolase [Candidatus Binatia bacterium]
MSEPRHRVVDSQGLAIHCLEWGDPAGKPVVLVHGFLDQAYSWKFFVDALMHRSRQPLWIVAPDCRGHGDSGWVGSGGYYHFPDYVFDLDCVIRDLGVTPFCLIGHSMGGTISFLYAGSFPERVGNLVLIEGVGPLGMNFADAPARMAGWIGELHARGRNHFREYTSVAAGAAQLQQTNPRLRKDDALDLARAAMKENANGKWVWKFDPLHRTVSPQPFYTAQALEFFSRIACPTLIVNGEESRQTRRTDRQQRYDAIPDHRVVAIGRAGHMIHQDNPEELGTVIAAFLELSQS